MLYKNHGAKNLLLLNLKFASKTQIINFCMNTMVNITELFLLDELINYAYKRSTILGIYSQH
jgi:hypothetical protein